MSQKSKMRARARGNDSPAKAVPAGKAAPFRAGWLSGAGVMGLLVVLAFLLYWPSLKSDFVYDANYEILEEGFITSWANLPDVLSFKVLGENLILADRPGTILYLMIHARLWGKEPWGFHLGSNLLHALNAGLLFLLGWRLVEAELPGEVLRQRSRMLTALFAVTLIFAVHPIAAETVSGISYCSDLLMTFFTLIALCAATAFRADDRPTAWVMGALGTVGAFAAVACKESGLAAALLLVVYWALFRRKEEKRPWLCFLAAANAVTLAFLAARFLMARPSLLPVKYLGGSLPHAIWLQPELWVFMIGKLFWPVRLSADYTLDDLGGLTPLLAWVILIVVLVLQAGLAMRSRIGAVGVAMFWLGLLTVSNFMPLYRVMADRFYYLPLAGFSLQLLALLLPALKSRLGFWLAVAPLFLAAFPLALLSVDREKVFATEQSLWADTVQASPQSSQAHNGLGTSLSHHGFSGEAVAEYDKALKIEPDSFEAHYNLGVELLHQKRLDEAETEFRRTLELNPNKSKAAFNLAIVLVAKGQVDEAVSEYRRAVQINPWFAGAHNNLGILLAEKGDLDAGLAEFEKAVQLDPSFADAHNNLGSALMQRREMGPAILHFQEAARLDPGNGLYRGNLARAKAAAAQD